MTLPNGKIRQGDGLKKLSARALNSAIEAGTAFRERQAIGQIFPTGPQAGTILIKNTSGADRSRFDILGIDSVLFTPTDNLSEFQNNFALTCVAPTVAHAGKFVILCEPIADGKIGRAVIDGLTAVQVDIKKTLDVWADVTSATGNLESGNGGLATILYKETAATGVQWCIVKMGPHPGFKPVIRFTIGAALSTANASVLGSITNQWGSGIDNPDSSITLHNVETKTAGQYIFEGQSGSAGPAHHMGGQDYLMQNLECP